MKKVLTLVMSMLILMSAEAQKAKKPNINKAKTLWTQGKLDEAKSMIDAATEYEKTMNEGKTWYYRGLIYATIDTTSTDFSSLSENPREVAIESFAKADEMAEEGKGYFLIGQSGLPTTMDQQIAGYYGYYFNEAVKSYEKEDLAIASEQFECAWSIMKSDTSAVTNAGYAAQANGDNDRAMEMFEKALSSGANGLNIYFNMIAITNGQEDWEGGLALIRRAKEFYPTDNSLNRSEVTALIKLEKVEEAKEQLIAAIENEPTDPVLRFSLGLLYEETEDLEMAISSYQNALEVAPDHYESNFNLAVIQFNKANTLYKQMTQLGISSADRKKEKELRPKIKKGFEDALPFWEKVYKIKAEDQSTLQTLMFIYSYLNMNDKAAKMETELDALD